MTVITISRQKGSLGDEIARMLSSRLGYHLYDREIINKAARESGAPDAALAEIDELGLLGVRLSDDESCAFRAAIMTIIQDIANEDNVIILGRGGQVVLRDHPGCLHVRIFAPQAIRVIRVSQKLNIGLEHATRQVKASDKHSSRHLKDCYHVDWDDPLLYDLMLNTLKLQPGPACDLICSALAHLPQTGVSA